MEEQKEEIEKISTESILEVVQEGSEIYSEITSNFIQSFVFYEKTLYEWASDLMVEIPDVKDLDSVEFRKILLK